MTTLTGQSSICTSEIRRTAELENHPLNFPISKDFSKLQSADPDRSFRSCGHRATVSCTSRQLIAGAVYALRRVCARVAADIIANPPGGNCDV